MWDKELDELSVLASFSFVDYVNNKVSESKMACCIFLAKSVCQEVCQELA